MNLQTWLTILTSFALILLTLAAFFRRSKTRQIRTLIGLLVTVLLWIVLIYLSNQQISTDIDIFINKAIFAVVPVFIVFFFNLVQTFREKPGYKTTLISYLFLIPLIILAFSPWVVSEIHYDATTAQYNIKPGQLYPIFIFVTASSILLPIYQLIRLQRQLTGIARSQLRMLIFGTGLLTALMVFSNVVLPRLTGSSEFASIAPLWLLLWLGIISYSIFRHRLFEVNFILGKLVFYTLFAGLLYAEYYIAYFLLEQFFGGSTSAVGLSTAFFIAFLAAAATHNLSTILFTRISNRLVYLSYNPQKLLRDLSQKLSNSLDMKEIGDTSCKIIHDALQPTRTILLLTNSNDEIEYICGIPKEKADREQLKGLTQAIASQKFARETSIILYEELSHNSEKLTHNQRSLVSKMKNAEIHAVVPLDKKTEVKGLLLLGRKESHFAFSSQDINFLENTASIIAVSVGRALLYKEVQNFNVTLKKKVANATEELKDRNDELQDLYDNLEEIYQKEKDLMDVAGHEFRTPASILKNNLYLLKKRLKEVYPDKSDEKINTYLERLIEGTDRQIKLVNTFLETARIDNQRFEIEVDLTDISDLIDNAVSDMKQFAKQKGLQVIFHKPSHKVFCEVDVVRIREVIDNLLNNAVKYTKDGYIEITLTDKDSSVMFTVKDTGIGIKEEDQTLLFKKFSRVENYIGGDTTGSIVRPGGTGLGLYVSRTIIDAHGGSISVESEVGKGSTFSFEIPKQQPSYVRRTGGVKSKLRQNT